MSSCTRSSLKSSSTPSTFRFSWVTSTRMESQHSFLSNSSLHPAWISTQSPSAIDDTDVVDAEASSNCFLAVSPCCRSALQHWQTSPGSASGGEPLVDALCQTQGPSEAHRQPVQTWAHERGVEERDPVKDPPNDSKLLCGEQRQREEGAQPSRRLHPVEAILHVRRGSANCRSLATRVRWCPDPGPNPSRTGRRELRC